MLSSGPGCDWKYHHGMPFCAAITAAPGLERGAEPRREPGQAVGLQPDEDDVGVARSRRGRRSPAEWPWKSPRGLSTCTPCSCMRAQVRAAGDQRHVAAAAGERRADVGADRAGAEDRELHAARRRALRRRACAAPCRSASAGSRRARGSTSGTLNAASRSRQWSISSRSSASPLSDDRRADALAVLLVVDPEADRVGDGGVREQDFLDLVRARCSRRRGGSSP